MISRSLYCPFDVCRAPLCTRAYFSVLLGLEKARILWYRDCRFASTNMRIFPSLICGMNYFVVFALRSNRHGTVQTTSTMCPCSATVYLFG